MNPHRHGFRKKHSTELGSLHLTDYLGHEMDIIKTPLNIYLDLSKCFDSLDHALLFSKLEFGGVIRIAHHLFNIYLSHRKQFVQYESSNPDLLNIKHGVPQGSILEPLLFYLYK